MANSGAEQTQVVVSGWVYVVHVCGVKCIKSTE